MILAVVVLAVAVVGVGIFTFTGGVAPVSSKDVGFNIIDSTHATVDFEVTKDAGATAQCAVQVLSEQYAVVGWKVETIGPNPNTDAYNGGRTTSHRSTIRTESLGVSGGVHSCWMVHK